MHAYVANRKACSVCGTTFSIEEFNYGNRENRSYCRACSMAVSKAYSQGGSSAARAYREEQRRKWKSN
jgi:hypothetical protein